MSIYIFKHVIKTKTSQITSITRYFLLKFIVYSITYIIYCIVRRTYLSMINLFNISFIALLHIVLNSE